MVGNAWIVLASPLNSESSTEVMSHIMVRMDGDLDSRFAGTGMNTSRSSPAFFGLEDSLESGAIGGESKTKHV